MKATTRNLTEGTPIVADDRFGKRSGTVESVSRDYNGKSWAMMVTFMNDETGKLDGAWLKDVTLKGGQNG